MRLAKGKEITVLSARELSLKFTGQFLTEDTIVILLSMENYDYPVFKEQDNVLKIEVQDTLMKDSPYAFTAEHGLQVKEFLDKACFKRLFVCCDSGESRSAALAAAIMVYYGNPDMEIWKNPYFHPNLLVYAAQLKAFGIKCTPLKLKFLRFINNRNFKKAIKGN